MKKNEISTKRSVAGDFSNIGSQSKIIAISQMAATIYSGYSARSGQNPMSAAVNDAIEIYDLVEKRLQRQKIDSAENIS